MAYTPVNRSLAVSTASQQMVQANTLRERLLIKNDSASDIWINPFGPASATPGGGNIRIVAGSQWDEKLASAVQVIGAAAANITVWEYF